MSTLQNNYDFIESIIYTEGLCIKQIDFHKELDLMLIVLNTKTVLQHNISQYSLLKNATIEQLNNFELMANGTGVNWPTLDEDLSLKGFLQYEIKKFLTGNSAAA